MTTDIKNYFQKKFKKVHVINRPKHLASDKSSTEITMLHAIQEFKKENNVEIKILFYYNQLLLYEIQKILKKLLKLLRFKNLIAF